MHDRRISGSVEAFLRSRLAEPGRRLARMRDDHPFAGDLALSAAIVGLSVIGLASQRRLDTRAIVFCLALCAPLLLRGVSRFLCFATVALVALAQWLWAGPQLADAAVLIALYWVALHGRLVEIAVAAATVELGAIIAAVRWSPGEPLKVWVGLTGLATASAVLGITIRQRRALLVSLQEKAARLEFERDQEGRLGAAAERARIAREMHDIVSHNLSVMIALADGASYAMTTSPELAGEATARVSATGREALVEMRRLLGVLGDESSGHPLEPQPKLDRLDELLKRVEAAGIPVTMELAGDPHRLADGVQLTVFRVAQEALTNTLKHAARPTRAHVALRVRAGLVELDVTDTGRPPPLGPDAASATNATHPGPSLPASGRGLRGMRERALAYGGDLEAGPGPAGGWRVRLRLQAAADANLGVGVADGPATTSQDGPPRAGIDDPPAARREGPVTAGHDGPLATSR
jgi:signal transduction histidine kinase